MAAKAPKPSEMDTDVLVEQMRSLEWYINTWYPHELKATTHARRLASLKRGLAEAKQSLSAMTTEYGSRLQEKN